MPSSSSKMQVKAWVDAEAIQRAVLRVRSQNVLLDADLAELYGVDVRALNQAVQRNADRFPSDFMFKLTAKEAESLRSQSVICVRVKDPEWHVPVLWRSEMRSILAGYLRDGSLSAAQARRVMRQVEEGLAGCEHLVSSDAVLKVIDATRLSAHDAEFVALSKELSVPLVTEDKAVLKAFPEAALSMDRFLA
jgi:predicted nucleic acid-binding protein